MHDFEDKLREGQGYERILDRYFGRAYDITPVTDWMQRKGHDRIFQPKDGGPAFGVEYKGDARAADTGNIFVETESVDRDRQMGWALTAQAPVLMDYVPPMCVCYEVPMPRLRSVLPMWRERYPEGKAPNRDYNTVGVLVPLPVFAAIAMRVHLIPPSGDPDDGEPVSIEVLKHRAWDVPLWGHAPSWRIAHERVAIACRLWPGLRWRVVMGA